MAIIIKNGDTITRIEDKPEQAAITLETPKPQQVEDYKLFAKIAREVSSEAALYITESKARADYDAERGDGVKHVQTRMLQKFTQAIIAQDQQLGKTASADAYTERLTTVLGKEEDAKSPLLSDLGAQERESIIRESATKNLAKAATPPTTSSAQGTATISPSKDTPSR